MAKFLGIICGLKSEAETLNSFKDNSAIRVAISGAHAGRAGDAARAFAAEGATGLLSFGVSGGLSPMPKTGDVIIATDVVSEVGAVPCEASWCEALSSAALMSDLSMHFGPVYGSDIIVGSAADKRKLGRDHKALAVDMESHGVAEAAREAKLPFAAVRAIADGPGQVIPASAAKGVAADGSVRALPVLGAALRRPMDFPELIRVGRDSATAHKSLRRSAGRFIPALLRVMDLD